VHLLRLFEFIVIVETPTSAIFIVKRLLLTLRIVVVVIAEGELQSVLSRARSPKADAPSAKGAGTTPVANAQGAIGVAPTASNTGEQCQLQLLNAGSITFGGW